MNLAFIDTPWLAAGKFILSVFTFRFPTSGFGKFRLPHSHFPLPHSHLPTFYSPRYALCPMRHAPSSHFRIPTSEFFLFHFPSKIIFVKAMHGRGPGIPRRPSPGLPVCREPGTHAGKYRNRCIVEDPHRVSEAVSEFEPGFPMTVAVQTEIRCPLSNLFPSC